MKRISLFIALMGIFGAAQAGVLAAWKLPPVPVPKDDPLNAAKEALGHQLMFDFRLSKNDSMNCASCHLPAAGGAGPTPRAFGHGGELGRWAPSWVNSAYYTSLFWDGRADSLEQQTGALPGHLGPISAPGEMGGDVKAIVERLNAIPGYKKEFEKAFGEGASGPNIAKAIASYERTLIAADSPFQRYVSGEKNAISASAKRGFDIFQGKGRCTLCHTPPLMTDNGFHNIGVPQVGPLKEDLGRYGVTKDPADKGRFKTPSLYNSGAFAFFMHDGAFSSLQQVVDHYSRGGNPKDANQDPLITKLDLTSTDKADLIAFLRTLTDERLDKIHEPKLP